MVVRILQKEKILKQLRYELNDLIEPLQYDNDYLESVLNSAVLDYSQYRPLIKKGILSIKKGDSKSYLPNDFMKQKKGFELYDCLFFNKDFVLIYPVFDRNIEIEFVYYAFHTLDTVCRDDISFLYDFSIWKILTSNTDFTSKVNTINVGKNLGIKTDNSIYIQIANERLKHYITGLTKNNIFGSWM